MKKQKDEQKKKRKANEIEHVRLYGGMEQWHPATS